MMDRFNKSHMFILFHCSHSFLFCRCVSTVNQCRSPWFIIAIINLIDISMLSRRILYLMSKWRWKSTDVLIEKRRSRQMPHPILDYCVFTRFVWLTRVLNRTVKKKHVEYSNWQKGKKEEISSLILYTGEIETSWLTQRQACNEKFDLGKCVSAWGWESRDISRLSKERMSLSFSPSYF